MAAFTRALIIGNYPKLKCDFDKNSRVIHYYNAYMFRLKSLIVE